MTMKLKEHDVIAVVRRVQLRELRLWVSEGWIRPAQGEDGPLFDEMDIARIRLICDLRKEMSLPSDALPVVLSLLDQMYGLRNELRNLAAALDRQPEETRTAVLERSYARKLVTA